MGGTTSLSTSTCGMRTRTFETVTSRGSCVRGRRLSATISSGAGNRLKFAGAHLFSLGINCLVSQFLCSLTRRPSGRLPLARPNPARIERGRVAHAAGGGFANLSVRAPVPAQGRCRSAFYPISIRSRGSPSGRCFASGSRAVSWPATPANVQEVLVVAFDIERLESHQRLVRAARRRPGGAVRRRQCQESVRGD